MNKEEATKLSTLFKGSFRVGPGDILERLAGIRAFVFDWDGVFNNGFKDAGGSSPFNEVDSMGINMLRFSHYLRTHTNPVTAIISGENNAAARTLATREHFHGVYSGIKNKTEALYHLCAAQGITPAQVAFFFDDVLDLALAPLCGLRIMVGRQSSPLLTAMVQHGGLADYITAADGGNCALREAAELLIGVTGQFEHTIMERVKWSEAYTTYLATRNSVPVHFFTHSGSGIIEQ